MTIDLFYKIESQQENRRRPNSFFSSAFLLLLLVLLFLSFVSVLHAQNPSTGETEKSLQNSSIFQVFDQEMEHYNPSFTENASRKPLRSSLPAWWPKCFNETADTLFIFGVSDPGLPDSLARAQAIHRAYLLAALSKHCKGTLISDFYIKSQEIATASKFEEMYLFSASTPLNFDHCRMVRSARLKSKEMVILVAIPVVPDTAQPKYILQAGGYFYNCDSEVEGKKNLIRKISCTVSGNHNFPFLAIPDTLSFYQVNKNFTGIKNSQIKFGSGLKRYDYYYSPIKSSSGQNAEDRLTGSSCKSGLWIALLNQVFEQLSFYVKKQTKQTQVVQDQTTELRNELNREKNQVNIRFTFKELSLSENNLKVQINISHED